MNIDFLRLKEMNKKWLKDKCVVSVIVSQIKL